MRVLLDECLPRRLKADLSPLDVATVPELGWAGTTNGALLTRAAAGGFDAFVTIDRGIPYQQNLAGFPLRIVLLRAPSNRYPDVAPLMPAVRRSLEAQQPGELAIVPAPA